MSISMQSARFDAHAAWRSLLDGNDGDSELADDPGVGHQMSGRACNREFGGTGSNRKRQEQLVGEVEFDGGCRCVMLAQRANRLVGNAFGRPPQPAIGGKTRLQRHIIGEQKDAGAGTGCGDPLWPNVDGNAEIFQGFPRSICHPLRNVRRQICGDRSAADPLQCATFERMYGARPSGH